MKPTQMKSAIAVAGFAALLAAAPEVYAQNCNTFLSEIESYVTSDPSNHILTMNMVTLATAKPVPPALPPLHGQATYSEALTAGWPAPMAYVPAHQLGSNVFPATLQGRLSTLYSDHRWSSNTSFQNPFSPFDAGQRIVTIFLGDYPHPPVRYSKGDVVITDPDNLTGQPPNFRASCQFGLMYGFVRQNQIVAITLNKSEPVIQ